MPLFLLFMWLKLKVGRGLLWPVCSCAIFVIINLKANYVHIYIYLYLYLYRYRYIWNEVLYYIIAACLSLSIPHKPPGSDNLLSWFALICDGGVQGAEGYTRRERPHCFNFFENLDSVLTGRLEIIYVQPGHRALVKCGLSEESCIRHSVKWSDFSLAF